MKKKIVILDGGPRANGNTAALIREFAGGAEAVGGSVTVFHLGKMAIHGCLGCLGGGKNPDSPCVQKDDMDRIYPAYREADIVVFASPMYYFGFSGQLKTALDRLFAVTECESGWKTPHKSAVMLMAAGDDSAENEAPAVDYYRAMVKLLGWEDLGHLVVGGVLRTGDIAGRPELETARKLGKSIAEGGMA